MENFNGTHKIPKFLNPMKDNFKIIYFMDMEH